jgi:mannose-6-phosphate isomerase-like protein (cupin superfamily)
MGYAVARIDELDRAVLGDAGDWRPIRRALGITAVGINAYTADRAGALVIEAHDELGAGSGHHEEVYVVLTGGATFTVGADEFDAPVGTVIRVDPEDHRKAIATADGTTLLVVGGKPGAAFPPSPFEYWYAAIPAYQAQDYARALEIASEGLEHYAEHGLLNYQLACYHALAGDTEAAVARLRIAFANEPRARAWAESDSDLDGVPLPG